MKKEILSLSLATLVGVSGILIPSSTQAESPEIIKQSQLEKRESTFSKEDLKKVQENLIQMGVDKETTKELINKLENGGVLDADVLSDEDAINTIKSVKDDTTTVTYVYPDGSRSQSISEEMETDELVAVLNSQNNGGFSTQSISGGSCSSGSGYAYCSNRKISRQYSTYGYSFYASYELVNGGYDRISYAGNWNIWTAGGTYTNQSMRTIRGTETYSYNAEARLSATLNLGNSAGSITRSLSLHVGDDKAWDTWNQYY